MFLRLPLDRIRTDDAIDCRLELEQSWFEALAKAVRQGYELPPVVCFYDGNDYWLADGFDFLEAAKLTEQETILANIRQGSLQDAISYSKPKSQRSIKEKQQVVEGFLFLLKSMGEEDKKKWSWNKIARRCNVNQRTVRDKANKLGYKPPNEIQRSDKNGNLHLLRTHNLGQSSKLKSKGFDWAAINDKQFEELVYEIVKAHHPVDKPERRSGTGGQGRDLQAKFISKGSLGEHREEIYFIEAKHHQSGVSPDDISGAFTWAQAEQPSALVIAVSSHLTNPCKDYIRSWRRHNPKVRVIVWERGDIEDFIKYQPSTRELAMRLKLVFKSWLDKQLPNLSKQVIEEYQNLFIEFVEKLEKVFGISIDTNKLHSKLEGYGFSALAQKYIGKSCEEPEVDSIIVTAFRKILDDLEQQKNI